MADVRIHYIHNAQVVRKRELGKLRKVLKGTLTGITESPGRENKELYHIKKVQCIKIQQNEILRSLKNVAQKHSKYLKNVA